jgi:hypothetical protein
VNASLKILMVIDWISLHALQGDLMVYILEGYVLSEAYHQIAGYSYQVIDSIQLDEKQDPVESNY